MPRGAGSSPVRSEFDRDLTVGSLAWPHSGTITCGGPFLSWTEVRETDDGRVSTVVVARWAD